jgi:hypothetical protein
MTVEFILEKMMRYTVVLVLALSDGRIPGGE